MQIVRCSWTVWAAVLTCAAVAPQTVAFAQPSPASGGAASAASRPPNILFIITDQQHAEMMSCAGNAYVRTPALDSLARDGIRFTNAYVANPVCVPSRISMATGVMAGRLGVLNNGMRATVPDQVAANSLGKLIKSAGYDTFYGGKVHMCAELNPLEAGYDEYFPDQRDALPRACIDFVTRKRERPFFAVASFINPHDICYAYRAYKGESPRSQASVEHLYRQAAALPLDQLPPLPANFEVPADEPDAVEEYLKPGAVTPAGTMRQTYDQRQWRIYRWIYCRLAEQVDEHIAQILASLKQNGLESETLVVFTSDHGDMDACHRLASKGCFYEQSVRVPMLIRYPGRVLPGGVDSTHLVSSGLDILPTLCDYAGVRVPNTLLGRSLRPIAEGKPVADWRRYVVTENHTGRMLRSRRYKYCVYNSGEQRESLVDLANDPGEMKNLATSAAHTEALVQHRRYLKDWIEQSGDRDAKTFAILEDPLPASAN